MPTIIDALIVQLGLDATAFKKGQREVNDSWQKARGTQLQHARAMEDGNKKLLESFNKLKTEAVGFFAALLGTREIKAFIEQINQANAAVGRLATNIGENPQMLQAWGSAVERFGGKAEDAQSSLTALSKAFFDLKYQGRALPDSIYRAFAMTGRTVDTSKGVDAFLRDYAASLKDIAKTDRAAAFWLGEGGGLTPSMVSLMTQYGAATLKFVEAQKGLGATDEQIRNSEKLIEEWSRLKDTAEAIGRDIENWFSEPFLKILAGVQEAFDAIHGITSQNPKDVANQIGMNEAAGGLAASGVTAGGTAVTKSNPLPVQIVPNANGGGTGSGQSWWDWLFGGAGAASGGGSSGGATPMPAPSGSGKGPGPGDAARTRLLRRLGSAKGAASIGPTNGNFNAGNAQAVRDAAAELGTTPEDLATVIGYETGGTYSPSKWGGAGGNYLGLIQFGPAERNQFGVNERQTFAQQMKAVVAYLKARGFKPGMGLMDLYSTINAGSPGHYGASDGYGTVASHVARMQRETLPLARTFLNSGSSAGGFRRSKGEYVNGNLVAPGANADPRIWKPNGGGVVDWDQLPPEYRGGSPGPGGFDAVQRDNAAGDRKHGWKRPSMYHPLWHGLGGSAVGVPGPGASLSTIHNVHPVTTSSTSNAMHIAGGIHVNAPYATDARGIAADIYAALGSYQSSMGMQSGQV